MNFPRGFLVFGIALTITAFGAGRASASPNPYEPGVYGQERGWEEPPGEFNEAQRHGHACVNNLGWLPVHFYEVGA